MLSSASRLVLVTGAMGWLGRGLIQALLEGLPDIDNMRIPDADVCVRALLMPSQDTAPIQKYGARAEAVCGDLRSLADCQLFCKGTRDATLFHTAGIIHPHRVREFYDINVIGTQNLLRAAVAAGVKRAVIVSSNSPCGFNPHPDHLFDEDSPYRPYMNYGRSKMLMEQNVRQVQALGRIETVIIRPPWFYGPYQPPRQTRFFRMIRDGKMPLVGRGHNQRSMGYIDNIVQGLLLAARADRANGQMYWIADARPYTMTEIIDTVESLLENEFGQKCAHRRPRLPHCVGDAARAVDWLMQAVGGYNQSIHVLSEMNASIACSVRKAERELGYTPAIELQEGMRRSLRWLFAERAAAGGDPLGPGRE